jgi:hypothetical protein
MLSAANVHLWTLICLCGFLVTAAIDSSYYHFFRHRLYADARTIREHGVHALRAGLLSVAMVTYFEPTSCAAAFRVGTTLVLLDLGVQLWDMFLEKQCRAHLGGLEVGEYMLHGVGTMFHVGALSSAWFARGMSATLDYGLHELCVVSAVGSGLSFVQHLYYLHPRHRRTSAAVLSPSSSSDGLRYDG